MASRETPEKRDVARQLLVRGSVFLHIDARARGVDVPEAHSSDPNLVLQIGLDLAVPIPDLRVDASGVHATLSFQRRPYTCRIPWKAVYAIVGVDGRAAVWPEDLPPEIAREVERHARGTADKPATRARGKRTTKPVEAPSAKRGPQPARRARATPAERSAPPKRPDQAERTQQPARAAAPALRVVGEPARKSPKKSKKVATSSGGVLRSIEGGSKAKRPAATGNARPQHLRLVK